VWRGFKRGCAALIDFQSQDNGFMYGLKPVPFKGKELRGWRLPAEMF
jgi:hypothetical protein